MFNRLPPELVRQIIESAIPSPFLSSNYAERQKNLRAFCLVCRYLRQETQPLLFQYILADWSPHTLNEALKFAQSKGWTRCIRQASIKASGSLLPMKSRFERLARNGRGLRILTLAYLKETVDISLLRTLPQLQQVRLFGKSFKIGSRFVLPRLESLTLSHDSACALLPMLSPRFLPALRSLAMPKTNEANFDELRGSRIAGLSRQLDAIFLSLAPHQYLDCTNSFPANSLHRTLFDSWFFTDTEFTRYRHIVQHLRLRACPDDLHFAPLCKAIKRGDLHLKSLYLPVESQYSATPFAQNLSHTCRENSIDIVYEEQDVGWAGSYMSEEFCRRQRELRLEAAAYD